MFTWSSLSDVLNVFSVVSHVHKALFPHHFFLSQKYDVFTCMDKRKKMKQTALKEDHVNKHIDLIVSKTDHVYLLCYDCDHVRFSNTEKVSMVDGHDIDDCFQPHTPRDHYHRATLSHYYAIQDALHRGFEIVTIAEEDFYIAPTSDLELVTPDIVCAIHNSTWNIIRLGYLYGVSQQPGSCPSPCVCEFFSAHTCMMRSRHCDMRSSEFYILRMSGAARSVIKMIQKNKIIDYGALSYVENQLYTLPRVTFQRGRVLWSENSLLRTFEEHCVREKI